MPSADVATALDAAHRSDWARVLASVARRCGGDVGLAEEATQEAFVAALETWGRDGVPRNPAAWLTATAGRKAVDQLRRRATLQTKLPALVEPETTPGPGDDEEEAAMWPDDRLRLVFTCCHESLAPEARTALTLRMVCGLTTTEIARAFLVPEATMAARLTRAKRKIATAGIPYRVPDDADLPRRLDGVLTVVHLVFTAGHTAAGDTLVREDLVAQALDLARLVAVLLPDEPEALGLLALLELTDARRPARLDAAGGIVPLEEQDRSRWDRVAVARGQAHLDQALRAVTTERRAGRFVLQAAIADVHASAPSVEATDWPAVLALYDRLLQVWPSPVVRLNRAAAVGLASGAEAGLAALEPLRHDATLAGYHYLPAARADLLRRLGRWQEAAAAYREALSLGPDAVEREFLDRRLAEVSAGSSSSG